MAFLEKKYRITTDEYGLAVIEVTGRCTADEVLGVESKCTRRYKMETLPNSSGAVLKSLDGTQPMVVMVIPPTVPRVFRCVKVDGRCNPFAYTQPAGPYSGKAILSFLMKYQEVGGVS